MQQWEQKNSKFSEFRRSQEFHEELSGLKLNALLITPVQRIPRLVCQYSLLAEFDGYAMLNIETGRSIFGSKCRINASFILVK